MCYLQRLQQWWPVGCYNSEKVGNHWPGLSLEARKENKIVQILSQSKLCLCQATHSMLASGYKNAAAHTRGVSRSLGFTANHCSQRSEWIPCTNSTSYIGNKVGLHQYKIFLVPLLLSHVSIFPKHHNSLALPLKISYLKLHLNRNIEK